MTRAEAVKKLMKLYGPKAYWRVSNGVSSPEQRAAALEQMRALRAQKDALDADLKARLAACDWYQELRAQQRDLSQRIDREQGNAMYHKFSIGKNLGGLFTEITASGDTWEECFAKVEQKAAKAS